MAGDDVIRQWESVLADENALSWLTAVASLHAAGLLGGDDEDLPG